MGPAPWYRRWAWALVAGLALLLVVFGVFVLFSPVDPNDFESGTGVLWSEFSTTQPDVAGYLEREARLLASVIIGFGLLVAGVVSTLVRTGNRTAWILSWIFPATLTLIAVVFFASDAAALGSYYAVATVVAAVGVGLAGPFADASSD